MVRILSMRWTVANAACIVSVHLQSYYYTCLVTFHSLHAHITVHTYDLELFLPHDPVHTMSNGSSSRWEEGKVDTSSPEPLNHHDSVMRGFLESGAEWEWPDNLGKCSGKHCDISRNGGRIPLRWRKIISDKTNASVEMYEAGPEFSFQKPFVVKTIRGPDIQKAREKTAKEVENMKDLRHPHVAALLATFTYQARLSILIFPAACCDLHQFMKRMSKGFGKDWATSHSDCTSTVDSDMTNSRPRDSNVSSASKNKKNDPQEVHSELWPLTTAIDKQIEMLRGYFVCLSQALSYLHASGVRHKDIKPENILIDETGSVILTDFGISRRFPKHAPHATNNEWNFTRKYASPEIMKDRTTLRDDPSDVFSLGCVFLEMATLLLGKNLNNLSDHYATIINDSSKEEAYHCNLGNVHSWIDHLRASHGFPPVAEHSLLGEINEVQTFQPSPENHMIAALVDIRLMLDETPSKRPVSKGLWERFQHISAIRCRDCDPRRPADIWKPSARQQRDSETGLNNRRSLNTIEEKNPKSIEPPGDIDSQTFSTRLNPDRSLRKSRRGSYVSTSQQKYRRHGHIRTWSEPESPKLQLNGDIREGARAKVLVSEKANPGIAQASAITSRANVIYENFADAGRQFLNKVGLFRSPQFSRPQGTNLNLSDRRAIRQDQQLRASNQRRATGEDKSTLELKEYTPPPQMRIIVYDVSQTIAFETVFASLKGAYNFSPQQGLLV